MRALVDQSVLLGLGDVVDAEGHIPDESLRTLIVALRDYVDLAARAGAAHLTFLGTEPLRRASNQAEVLDAILSSIGQPLHVLSHEQEALLTLLGVTHGVPAAGPLLVLDIGGGSTEAIIATPGRAAVVGVLPTGSARLTAALVQHDPPTWFEINALRAEARRSVEALPQARDPQAVAVGGTVTNLTRLLPVRDPARLDGADLDPLFDLLARTPADALVTAYPINRRRAGQLAAGLALVEAVMERYGVSDVAVSAASLREGAILARAIHGDDWLARLTDLSSPTPASGALS